MKKSKKRTHWTAENEKDFQFSVAMNFIVQIENRLEELDWSQAEFAEKVGVSEARVSQLLGNPGNIQLGTMVRWAKAVNMKMAIVAYDDGDYEGERGPINPDIFRRCWEKMGRPEDRWAFDDRCMTIDQAQAVRSKAFREFRQRVEEQSEVIYADVARILQNKEHSIEYDLHAPDILSANVPNVDLLRDSSSVVVWTTASQDKKPAHRIPVKRVSSRREYAWPS